MSTSKPSLFQVIADSLRREIRTQHAAGDRLPTEKELAARFEVSVFTVREALAVLVYEGLLDRRRRRGTIVRDTLGKRQVAIVSELDLMQMPRPTFFWATFQQLHKAFAAEGVRTRNYIGSLPVSAMHDHEETTCSDLYEDIEAGRLLAVVVLIAPHSKAYWNKLRETSLPTIGHPESDHAVRPPQGELIREAGRMLLEAGRTNVGLIGWNPNQVRNGNAMEASLREMGLNIPDRWVRIDQSPLEPGAGWDDFLEIWTQGENRPDGLIVSDDMLFEDVVRAMLALQVKVPEDLMIVTHSNKGLTPVVPFPHTRLEVDPADMAQTICQRTLQALRGEIQPRTEDRVAFRQFQAGQDAAEQLLSALGEAP